MPTGYTAPVMDGEITDVKDFAAQCARGFGAFMHQRDESGKVSLRYPEAPGPDSFYHKSLAQAEARRAQWAGMSEEEKYAEWSDYVKKQTLALHESKANHAKIRARYEDMLIQVWSIDVPSKLQKFRDFMVEQLESSIDFDCGDGTFENGYYRVMPYPEWCEKEEAGIARDLSYYSDEVAKERQRYQEQVEYIDLMVETFGFEVEK